MGMSIPDWYQIALLALAAFRSWRLLAEDDILDRPRRYVTALGSEWRKEGDKLPANYRIKLMEFISCPYCLGAWIGLVWWGAFQFSEHVTLVVATPFAISALIVFANRLSESE